MFNVHIGYTTKGNDRWKRFETLDKARIYCEQVFQACGIVLTIVKKD